VENLTLLDNGVSNTQTFDHMALGPITDHENGSSPGDTSGTNGQGWTVLAPHAPEGVLGPDGPNGVRVSNDPGSGDFAGPYSPQLSFAAGEPDTGASFSSQSISFNFQAVHATPDGSRLEIDFGNAAGTDRDNFLAIESFADTGIRITVSEPD